MEIRTTDFAEKVIAESHRRPVVVDFWAPWCAPCRILGPILEQLEKEYAGKFLLAKVNTDAEPQLAQQYQVMGIPDVKIFQQGKIAAGFVGVRPPEFIRELLDQFIVPDGYDRILQLAASDPHKAKKLLLESALRGKYRDEAAWSVVRALLREKKPDTTAVRECLSLIPEVGSTRSDARNAALALLERGNSQELVTLFSEDESRIRSALETWLAKVEVRDEKEKHKELMVQAFQILGNDHPLVLEYRRKLAQAIY
ncbi:MAG: tetratricopeptide repeat protein [Leptospiraceae bacterium]|nr:tetratricopeptide repeat protein [Leptospiraceae bacterium]